ncbi:MAG: Na+/H+ antiporter NhaA [Proteobacteria bacterium]|nr:Na+/H+ antiporter NhaA [Pseudomonadota bacterium]
MNQGLGHLPQEPVDRFSRPFARFLRIEALAAVVLLLCAIVALALSNSQWSVPYLAFWDMPVGIKFGGIEFSRSIKRWIDDGAMTLFFFIVALELKREIVLGELRNPRVTLFSMVAALGGMLAPALIFLLMERGESAIKGWGVVMATDTAFVIGCLAVLGSRIPRDLRLFLLSVAIFDDVGAIMVIAIGYGSHVDWSAIAWAVGALMAIFTMGRIGIRQVSVYSAFGGIVWLSLDLSGIHPTLTGVVLGLMTPARSWVSDNRLHAILNKVVAYPRGEHWSGDTKDRQDLRRAGVAAREALSPLERLEMALHPWVAFAVLPFFALANAGLPLSTTVVDWRLAAAVTIGLFCGKPIGVVLFSYLAAKLKVGIRPKELSWPLLAGGALLTGIGFTMAILIAELGLDAEHLDSGKIGILCGSALSAACGLVVLGWLTSRHQRRKTAGASSARSNS